MTFTTPEQCADHCELDATCKGFRYKDSTGECQLKDGNLATGATEILSNVDVKDWYEPNPIMGEFKLKGIPIREYGCLWAVTRGGKMLSKRIDVEVCGTEELEATAPLSESATYDFRARDQVIEGMNYKEYDITNTGPRIQVKYPLVTQCRITDWKVTPETDTREYKIQDSKTKLAINTET